MNDIIVTVGSVTYAIKLKRLLSRANIRSKLVKVEDADIKSGCQHAVSIRYEDFYKAVVIMREMNIPYSIYNKRLK